MKLDEWFSAKLRQYENDLEFQRERLLYLLGERIAEMRTKEGTHAIHQKE